MGDRRTKRPPGEARVDLRRRLDEHGVEVTEPRPGRVKALADEKRRAGIPIQCGNPSRFGLLVSVAGLVSPIKCTPCRR